jgi:hypothetical protein
MLYTARRSGASPPRCRSGRTALGWPRYRARRRQSPPAGTPRLATAAR